MSDEEFDDEQEIELDDQELEDEEIESDDDKSSEASSEDIYEEELKNITKKEQEIKKTVVENNTRTQDRLTLFEYAAIIKTRTVQITSTGGSSYAKTAKEFDTPRDLAIKEFNEGMRPLKVYREIKKNVFESI